MKKLQVEYGDQIIEVIAQKIKGKLWFHYRGKTISYESESSLNSSGSKDAGSQDPTQVVAPMPGKIIKVHKSVGDAVSEGETLVTMEAMKMEYNLKALQDMMVSDVLAQEGDSVSLGQKLIGLEDKQ